MLRISEQLEAEFSMLSDPLEAESDDFLNNRKDLAYQTFQKPHHSEDDKFWSKVELLTSKNSQATTKPTHNKQFSFFPVEQPTATTVCNAESQTKVQPANVFIIKSQSPLGAKRVAKMNQILALDPVKLQVGKIHNEDFFGFEARSQTAKYHAEKSIDFELPNESRWVFNHQNLQKVPRTEIQLKQAGSARDSALNNTQQSVAKADTESSPRPHRPDSEQKPISQVFRKLKLQLKCDLNNVERVTTCSSSSSKQQAQSFNGMKMENNLHSRSMLSHKNVPMANRTQIHTPMEEVAKPKNLVVRKLEAILEPSIGGNVLQGRATHGGSQNSIKGAGNAHRSVLVPKRHLILESAIPSSEINLDSFKRTLKVNTSTQRSSVEDYNKPTSRDSMRTTATTPSSSRSMSKGQKKVLNKIFNFGF